MPLTTSLLEDLADPGAYPDRPRKVEVRETRRSWLFIAERFVYKLRKPWQIGRYDLSDYKARLDAADEELRLNRRLSPELYHGVVPVTRDELGRFAVQGEGEIVDWAIQRSWLPERATLGAQLCAGADLGGFWDDLGRRLSQFHQRVSGGASVSAYADAAVLERADETRVKELRRFVRSPDVHGRVELPLFTQAQWEELRRSHDEIYADAAIYLRGRVERGAIRDGHGALCMEHLFAVDGRAWVIGAAALEPTARFADGMRDVANLAVDLELAGHAKAAETFLSSYRKHSGEQQFSVLLEFYRRERSLARALEAAERALVADGDDRARFAREATTLVVGTAATEHERGLVWVGGLPGSWDDDELARVAATQGATLIPVRRDADALVAARAELARGRGALLAGGFWTAEDRLALRAVAEQAGVTLIPVLAQAKESECLDRLGADGREISHKNLGVWMRAKRRFQPPEEFAGYLRWDSSDTRRSLDAVLLEARQRGR
ncbi:MAG: hypothetical protein WD226_02430 [Planctomycetota bacterium]